MKPRLDEFSTQDTAYAAYAFATARWLDDIVLVFVALSVVVRVRIQLAGLRTEGGRDCIALLPTIAAEQYYRIRYRQMATPSKVAFIIESIRITLAFQCSRSVGFVAFCSVAGSGGAQDGRVVDGGACVPGDRLGILIRNFN